MLNNKNTIRKEYFERRKNLSSREVALFSEMIAVHAYTNFFLFSGKIIALYFPINNEVDPLALTYLGNINTAFPFIDRKEIVFKKLDIAQGRKFKNKLEVFSPPPLNSPTVTPDIIITPLIAFDEKKNRIGYGKGFYDRYLKNFNGISIGFAFEMQKISQVPSESCDIPLHYVITEDKIYF